jgi:hypothetical protein
MGEELRKTAMKKRILAIFAFCIICSFTLGARSLYDVSLGFGGSYAPSSDSDFFSGMDDVSNWRFGADLSLRIAILQAQMMVFPVECDDGDQGALLLGFAGINTPIAGNLLQLELGIGTGIMYVVPEDSSDETYFELADNSTVSTSDTNLLEAAVESPLYLMAGIGTELGSVGFHVQYLMESTATLEDISETGAWWTVFDRSSSTVFLALSLKMF